MAKFDGLMEPLSAGIRRSVCAKESVRLSPSLSCANAQSARARGRGREGDRSWQRVSKRERAGGGGGEGCPNEPGQNFIQMKPRGYPQGYSTGSQGYLAHKINFPPGGVKRERERGIQHQLSQRDQIVLSGP